jgi:hypothetical protein
MDLKRAQGQMSHSLPVENFPAFMRHAHPPPAGLNAEALPSPEARVNERNGDITPTDPSDSLLTLVLSPQGLGNITI